MEYSEVNAAAIANRTTYSKHYGDAEATHAFLKISTKTRLITLDIFIIVNILLICQVPVRIIFSKLHRFFDLTFR